MAFDLERRQTAASAVRASIEEPSCVDCHPSLSDAAAATEAGAVPSSLPLAPVDGGY